MSQFHDMLKILLDGVNPYHGFEYKQADVDQQGWNSDHPFFSKFLTQLRPKIIFEIGSWKGASARHMVNVAKGLGLDVALVAIDTFLGEDVLWNSPEWRSSLKLKNGRPTVYNTFMANCMNFNCDKQIIPLSMPSIAASRYLASRHVTADMIYIDGDHTFRGALDDMTAYWELLNAGGVMIIDDYLPGNPMFDDLVMAVEHFADHIRQPIVANGEKVAFIKPSL